jgi:IS30 family transposase
MSEEPKTRKPKKHGVVKIQQVICDLKAGKTVKQIADTLGVTRTAIERCCQRHGFSLKALNSFKEQKADLLAWKQSQIIQAMTPEKIKDASLRDQATTFNVLQNAERLERGQATANINLHSLNASLEEIDAEIERLSAITEATPEHP